MLGKVSGVSVLTSGSSLGEGRSFTSDSFLAVAF